MEEKFVDINNLKIGNTYKFRVKTRVRFSDELEIKDIVATYKSQDDERMHFIDRLGNGFGIFIKDIISASSTKVDPKEREALSNLVKLQLKQEQLEREYKEMIASAKNDVNEAVRHLKEVSTMMTLSDFSHEIIKFMMDTYNIDLRCNCWSERDGYFYLTQEEDISKWSSPEEYSFIHRRYDDTYYVEDEDVNYKRTLKNYSLNNILPLKKISSEMSEGLSLGDKRWLSVYKSYKIQVKEFSKQELERILKELRK
jgi:hypothetical protein